MSELIGRGREVARLGELLAVGVPLVSLWGPPGVGKSRLAREQVPEAPWATLVSCRTVDDVLRTVGEALGLEEPTPANVARAVSQHPRLVLDACDPARDALASLRAGAAGARAAHGSMKLATTGRWSETTSR